MSRPVRRQLGFTLVEVLVAVLVFGLVAAITYGGLDALTQASGEHTTRANEFAELQRAVAALDRDLRQLVSRPVRQADNSIAPALAAQVNGFAATRAGWVNPGSQRRGQLQRFAWQLQGEQLIRSYWPVTDVAAGSEQMIQLHTSGVVAIDFRYRDAVGQWHPRWPVDGTNERLPSAIEYRLQSRSFGEIRRLLVL